MRICEEPMEHFGNGRPTSVCDQLRILMADNWGPVVGCATHFDLNGDGYINIDDAIISSDMTEAECQMAIDSYNECLEPKGMPIVPIAVAVGAIGAIAYFILKR